MFDLRFNHQHDRRVSETGVGSEQAEQVGKPGDGSPYKSLWTAPPGLGERPAAPAHDQFSTFSRLFDLCESALAGAKVIF